MSPISVKKSSPNSSRFIDALSIILYSNRKGKEPLSFSSSSVNSAGSDVSSKIFELSPKNTTETGFIMSASQFQISSSGVAFFQGFVPGSAVIEGDDVLLATTGAKCIRFRLTDIRVFQGRNSTGVRGCLLYTSDAADE